MAILQVKDGAGNTKYLNVTEAGTTSNPFELVRTPYEVSFGIQTIFTDFGDTVSVQEKGKSLIKFGKNPSMSANVTEMVWGVGGIETLPTGNVIDEMVSDNAADTQDIKIEGHTDDGSGNLTFIVQSATLTGTTPVILTTPLARCTRSYNNNSTDLIGDVTIYENGGDVHNEILAGAQQSLKGATSISQFDYWIISDWEYSVNRGSTAVVDFELQIREKGKVFRTVYTASSANGGAEIEFKQPIIVQKNSDVRVLATSNANMTNVTTAIHGWLAIII